MEPLSGWAIALIVIGCYWLVSEILLHFPQLLVCCRRPRGLPYRIVHASHRGGSAERPENTIAAFDHGVACGTQLLELDVHYTADRVVVVHHDATLSRMCGVDKLITTVAFADLPRIKPEVMLPPAFHYPPGEVKWRPEAGPNGSANAEALDHAYRIPTLDAVLERYPNTAINIDCKQGSRALVDSVATIIERHNRSDSVVWGAAAHPTADYAIERAPIIPRFFSGKQALLTIVKYYTGLLPFLPLPAGFFEMGMVTRQLNLYVQNVARGRGACCGCCSWLCCWDRVIGRLWRYISSRKTLIRHLQSRGVQCIPWVLNDDSDFEMAFALGVDGVMTDCPERLTAFIRTQLARTNPSAAKPVVDAADHTPLLAAGPSAGAAANASYTAPRAGGNGDAKI